MSFFSFRRNQAASAKAGVDDLAAESVEVVRRRARQRLIGATILVLIGVIGFPLLFDSQPRPVPVDIAIEIPSRATVKPGTPIAAAPAAPSAAAAEPAASAPAATAVPPQASLQAKEDIVSARPAPVDPPAPAVQAKAADEGAKPGAAPKGKPETASSGERVVVQVGAYADEAKAREVRQRLEKAGLKTYTQVVDTGEGKRTRVRVGPFASRAEAEQAAAKIKSMSLPASVLVI